jgi:hypothetical protein
MATYEGEDAWQKAVMMKLMLEFNAVGVVTYISTYRNSPPKGHSQAANERVMLNWWMLMA